MHRYWTRITIAVLTVFVVAACAPAPAVTPEPTPEPPAKFQELSQDWIADLTERVAQPLTPHGPNNEETMKAGLLELSEEEIAQAKALDLRDYYYMGATLDVTEQLNELGMNRVLAAIGAEPIPFLGSASIGEQMDQVRTLVGKADHMSFVVAQAFEAVALGPSFVELADAGVWQIHNWTTPHGLAGHPRFVGLVDSDGYAQGVAAAEILAHAMNYQGEVGILYFGLEFWSTMMRLQGAEDTFAKYPNITVVAREAFTDPAEGMELALGMLTAHPEIDAVWAAWMMGPGTGAAEAVEALGRRGEVVVAAPDLGGELGARLIADPNPIVIGAVEGDMIEMGEASVNAVVRALLGQEDLVGRYFVVRAFPIVRANLPAVWTETNEPLFGPLPDAIRDLLEQPLVW
jgi:ribose transport system substrate-binding protein